MRRRFMFASALVTLSVAAPAAFADREVTTTVTDPIATSTAGDGGVADNVVISSTGRVTLTTVTDPALTLDSDNSVTNNGNITVTTDDDGGIGVHVLGGNTGSFTNSGSIQVLSETLPTDEDGDGDLDGDTATGGSRVAVLVDGAAVFTGDILFTSSSSIVVRGNDSAGIRILTNLDGNFSNTGALTIIGDDSVGIDVQDDISGDVVIGGSVTATGEDSIGVSLNGDIGGRLLVSGAVSSNGYRFSGVLTDDLIEEFDLTLDPEDDNISGSAIVISGNVAQGLLVNGPIADNEDTAVNESTVTAATVSSRGSAPAMHIVANTHDIVLGEVVIPAIPDDPDTTDVDESEPQQLLGYSFVNRGGIGSTGDLDGVDTTGLRIDGTGGFTTTLSEGMLNLGSIATTTYGSSDKPAVGTTFAIGEGAIIPVLNNSGALRATSVGIGGTARALVIEAGGYMPSLINHGDLASISTGGGSVIAVRDLSGTLTSVANTGTIRAIYGEPEDGVTAVPYESVAIDLGMGTANTLVHQYLSADAGEDAVVTIIGDILFGSGDDTLLVETGSVTGAISFGAGADNLVINGDAIVSGALSDSDGDLAISVDNGQLTLSATTDTTIREARFGDGSVLRFQVDHETNIAAAINATGEVTFEAGSRISSALTNLIGEGATYVVLTADSLVIEEALDLLQDTTAPYLYEAALNFDPNNSNALTLTLQRRTAEQLGMNANQASAYEASYAGWQGNAELGAAIASLTTEGEFFQAYDQLLPEYASSAIQFALATNDSAVGALANRLDAVRRSPENTGGLWVQEFGYYADRAGTSFGPGYRGHGLGLAVGFDQPFGPFYAAGINFVGSASEISEVEGFDDPMSAVSGQLGVYAGSQFGEVTVDFYGAAGYDSFEHNRRVLIGSYDVSPTASWSGYHIAGSARIGRDFTAGNYYFRPSASIDYLGLYEGSYTETGGGSGVDLYVDARDSSSFSSTALLTFGARYAGADSWWSPHIEAGFRNEFSNGETETEAQFVGYDDTFTLRSQQMPGTGFIFGFGIAAGSGYSVFSFDYDADLREDFIRHTARIVMRMVF
ncbi:autotransporter outer membrane beta-barrel domain-containing protein [Maricaulis sp.]|uniref:autotransporter outer membrane beta-barrel domain-containing protein n=1 Tax=Maricaulis sp. TaxID=1486257 RepID=UPI003A911994